MAHSKIKVHLVSVAAGLILAAAPGVAMARNNDNNNGNSNAGNRVTICHATGSQTNPFVVITPNANGVVSGHEAHQDSRDIIPPFDFNYHGTTIHFAGQNFDANGQAIFNNGCKVPGGQGGGQMDCDGDFDNSPASECTTTTTTTTPPNNQVLGAVTGGQGAGQVAVVPQGSVNGGEGAASSTLSKASVFGLFGSLLSAGAGLALFNRRQG